MRSPMARSTRSRRCGRHPLLAAHAARRRPALRLSDVVARHPDPRRAVRRPSARLRRGVRDRDRHARRSRRGGRRRPGRTEPSSPSAIATCSTSPRARGGSARHAGARATRPPLADDPPSGTAVVLLDRDGEIERSSARRSLAGRAPWRGGAPRWLPRPSRTGSRCRRARRWSASAKAGVSPSACSQAIRTHAVQEAVTSSARRPRPSRALGTRDRGPVRGRRDRRRGRACVGTVPEPARGPRAARAPGNESRSAHARRRRRPGSARQRVTPRRRRGPPRKTALPR